MCGGVWERQRRIGILRMCGGGQSMTRELRRKRNLGLPLVRLDIKIELAFYLTLPLLPTRDRAAPQGHKISLGSTTLKPAWSGSRFGSSGSPAGRGEV